MSSSTKLLNVSFIVRVLRNREANGTGGFNSKCDRSKIRRVSRGNIYTASYQHIQTTFNKKSQKASSPSSSQPSSDDPEAVGENSSFHFLLFLGGGSALGLSCLGRGFWLWETEEGAAVKPSKVFTWTPLCGKTKTVTQLKSYVSKNNWSVNTCNTPKWVHRLAAWLPTTNSYILPFVNGVQELHIYPLVHGLGITKVSKILHNTKKNMLPVAE